MSNEVIQDMNPNSGTPENLNIKEGAPDVNLRKDRLDRVIAMVSKYDKQIVSAVNQDFGNRDQVMSAATEVASVIGPMEHAKKNLKKWMKTRKKKRLL